MRSPRGGSSNTRGGTANAAPSTPTSDDPKAGTESAAGRDYWSHRYGSEEGLVDTAAQKRLDTAAATGTDMNSSYESAEGQALWGTMGGGGSDRGKTLAYSASAPNRSKLEWNTSYYYFFPKCNLES